MRIRSGGASYLPLARTAPTVSTNTRRTCASSGCTSWGDQCMIGSGWRTRTFLRHGTSKGASACGRCECSFASSRCPRAPSSSDWSTRPTSRCPPSSAEQRRSSLHRSRGSWAQSTSRPVTTQQRWVMRRPSHPARPCLSTPLTSWLFRRRARSLTSPRASRAWAGFARMVLRRTGARSRPRSVRLLPTRSIPSAHGASRR
mmetsp:Transcript_146957/g.366531  ORF Transcript_146957/g.366531 Transcript_146957/m.366531 type:complete len:201 (-) Transcript_146957:426-1028(-)